MLHFYETSKRGTRPSCIMYLCENRFKVAAYAARQRNYRAKMDLLRGTQRRLKFVREQFFLAAAAQNIKRLVRFLCKPTESLAVTA